MAASRGVSRRKAHYSLVGCSACATELRPKFFIPQLSGTKNKASNETGFLVEDDWNDAGRCQKPASVQNFCHAVRINLLAGDLDFEVYPTQQLNVAIFQTDSHVSVLNSRPGWNGLSMNDLASSPGISSGASLVVPGIRTLDVGSPVKLRTFTQTIPRLKVEFSCPELHHRRTHFLPMRVIRFSEGTVSGVRSKAVDEVTPMSYGLALLGSQTQTAPCVSVEKIWEIGSATRKSVGEHERSGDILDDKLGPLHWKIGVEGDIRRTRLEHRKQGYYELDGTIHITGTTDPGPQGSCLATILAARSAPSTLCVPVSNSTATLPGVRTTCSRIVHERALSGCETGERLLENEFSLHSSNEIHPSIQLSLGIDSEYVLQAERQWSSNTWTWRRRLQHRIESSGGSGRDGDAKRKIKVVIVYAERRAPATSTNFKHD
ncbi:hypothetical protein JB92DRAFT_3111340 [Gautieria morchelliformis]|nr:hypothetical protein JB92DRAFT_3111340 [Gautieria morchelliformis]